MPGPLALAPREDDNARIAKRLTARKRHDAPERPPPGPPVESGSLRRCLRPSTLRRSTRCRVARSIPSSDRDAP